MKQKYISSVSSDNLRNENIYRWIISPLLIQKWGEAHHFSLADLTSYMYTSIIIDDRCWTFYDQEVMIEKRDSWWLRVKSYHRFKKLRKLSLNSKSPTRFRAWNMKEMYISSVSSDNLRNENICGWIISPLLMQQWGGALHFSLADLTSYVVRRFYSFSFV